MSLAERLQPPSSSSSKLTLCSFPGEEARGRTPTRASTLPSDLNTSPHPSKPTSQERPPQKPSWSKLFRDALASPILTSALPGAAIAAIPPDSASYATSFPSKDPEAQKRARRERESPPARRISSRQVEIPDYTPFPAFESYNPPPLYRLLSRSMSRSRSHTEPKTLQRKLSQDAEDVRKIAVDHDVWLKKANGQPLIGNFSRLEKLRREG